MSLVKKEPEKKVVEEKKIDNSFNVFEEIAKCKSVTFLKVYQPMCITPEEKSAYDNRLKQLTA
jgi:hypothetical protein